MREYERKIAEAEMKVNAGVGGARQKEPQPRPTAVDLEDGASSSAQDAGSDTASDIPVSFNIIQQHSIL